MPSINRIRIINFSYNHDSRHIVDETFNFHGGENALLNLSNGGGKSVLVQLFLQVIVPMAKIQGRNIASFSVKKPAYLHNDRMEIGWRRRLPTYRYWHDFGRGG